MYDKTIRSRQVSLALVFSGVVDGPLHSIDCVG